MIFDHPPVSDGVDQGDVIEECPLVWFEEYESPAARLPDATAVRGRVVVLTQTCDLAQRKVTRVVVAVTVPAADIVASGQLKASDIRGSVRAGRVFGWYFLPADVTSGQPELIVDLRQIHTVPLPVLEELCQNDCRVARMRPLYREHLAKHFADTYSRIGLPEPYETE